MATYKMSFFRQMMVTRLKYLELVVRIQSTQPRIRVNEISNIELEKKYR